MTILILVCGGDQSVWIGSVWIIVDSNNEEEPNYTIEIINAAAASVTKFRCRRAHSRKRMDVGRIDPESFGLQGLPDPHKRQSDNARTPTTITTEGWSKQILVPSLL